MGSRLPLALCLLAALLACGEAQVPVRPDAPGRPSRPPPARPDPSPSPAPAPTPSLNPSTSLVDAAGAPLNCACQATQEYNPVCGSNGATYNNPSKLRCAQRCGYEVQLDYYGQCNQN